jgi:hypothetical protein
MADLTHRQEKIQQKRKQTPFREYLMEICSWYSLNIYKIDGILSRYPDTDRKGTLEQDPNIWENHNQTSEYTGDFFADLRALRKKTPKSYLAMYRENENSKYTDGSYGTKNCYLSFNL